MQRKKANTFHRRANENKQKAIFERVPETPQSKEKCITA